VLPLKTLTNKTLTTPTIASFTNATHNHTSAATGGSLVSGSIPNNAADTTGKSAKTDSLNSATTVVNVAAATAPSTGQVLTATDSTHAAWQTLSGANTALSNLASTAVNVSILPGTDASISLGDNTHRFLDIQASRFLSVPVGQSAGISYGVNLLSYDTDVGLEIYDSDRDSTVTIGVANITSSAVATYNLPPVATGTSPTFVVATAAGTTVGAAGGASALPALPAGYITIVLPSGSTAKIPYYTP
jgi:hypothetical protein